MESPTLDIGMPLDRLRDALLSVVHSPSRSTELTLAAINRRGRPMTVRVHGVSAGSGADHRRGLILVMQDVSADVPQRAH